PGDHGIVGPGDRVIEPLDRLIEALPELRRPPASTVGAKLGRWLCSVSPGNRPPLQAGRGALLAGLPLELGGVGERAQSRGKARVRWRHLVCHQGLAPCCPGITEAPGCALDRILAARAHDLVAPDRGLKALGVRVLPELATCLRRSAGLEDAVEIGL